MKGCVSAHLLYPNKGRRIDQHFSYFIVLSGTKRTLYGFIRQNKVVNNYEKLRHKRERNKQLLYKLKERKIV